MGIGDSKIEFRRRALELPNCKQEEFHEFLRLATSLDDFFALITAKDIRETLVTSSAVEQLISFACEIVELELLEPSEQKQLLLNAVRFLTRLLPFYFDSESAASPKQPSPLDLRPFVHMVYQLLFIPGFTISSPTACIWERGIGVSKDAPFTEHSNTQLDGNKTEVLRLLLVLLSKQMYRPSESELLAAAVCDLDRQLVLITLCSLLNTITNFQFSSVLPYNHLVFSGSVGTKQELVRSCFHVLTAILNCRFERSPRGSISGLVGSPRGTDDGQLLSPGAQPGGDGSRQQQPQAELKPIIGNMFRHYVSKLHRKQDFDVITDGLLRILNNSIDADQVYLPNSVQHLNMTEECLLLLWTFVTINHRYFAYLCESERSLDIVYGLVYQMLAAKSSVANIGVIRLCAFLLHIFSGERSFCVLLNRPFERTLPAQSDIASFRGNYGDLVVLTAHCLVTTTKGTMVSLYECLLTIVANLSPYVKSFCSVTANKIIGLLRKFSTASFLLANETNHGLLFYLLDFIDNAVQYQFDGNNHLIYALVRNKELVHRLSTVQFEALVQEKAELLERRRQQQQKGKSESIDGDSSNNNLHSPAGQLDENISDLQQSRDTTVPASAPSGFVPTKEWFTNWHGMLPLQTIQSLIETLVPQLERLCQENEWTDEAVLLYLRSGTLVGLLPVPHPIFIRKFDLVDGIRAWFTSYMWGVVYLRHLPPTAPIWLGTDIKLFVVKKASPEV